MVEFKNVSVTFRQKDNTVEAVSFKINKGDIFGIVGGSGAGKSTLLRTINLLQEVTSGTLIVDGEDVTGYSGARLRNLRKSIGMIFQHFNLAASRTVAANIAFALKDSNKSKEEIDKRVKEMLEFVNLSDKAGTYPSKLSGGQKQRVAIARALANDNTKILICDEPTSALDAETTASVLQLLKEVNKKLGVTIIIITHELDVVKTICNRTAVMNEGRVVEIGEVYPVFTNPKSDFTRQLIAHSQDFAIPNQINEDIKGTLVKITYLGDGATKSVLSDMTKESDIRYNIIHGKIEYIGSKPAGILYIKLQGDKSNIESVIEKLKDNTYSTEVI